jgi:hypothetical protein
VVAGPSPIAKRSDVLVGKLTGTTSILSKRSHNSAADELQRLEPNRCPLKQGDDALTVFAVYGSA